MRMKPLLSSLVALGLFSLPAAAIADTDNTTDQSMDQVLAQANTEGGAQTQGAAGGSGGMDARRERLQLGGDSAVTSGTQFNPAISVILDGVYGNFSDNAEDPPGFDGGHSHGHGHGHGLEEGFQIREAEVTFTGALDPYFDMTVVAGITDSDIELEEAFVETRALPAGFQVKAGKFLSDVGYINRQHIHDWDFVDQPWMREFIFGDEGLNEKGVQASWLAPTANYTKFGVEILEGETGGVANYVGEDRKQEVVNLPLDDDGNLTVDGNPDDGFEPGAGPERLRWRDYNGLDDKTGPRLFTAFANYAPNLGYDHAMQLGVSGGYADTFQDEDFHSSARLETWDGDAWFAGVDAVYKFNGQGIHGHRNLTLQAEYFLRNQDLTYRELQFADGDNFEQTDFANIRQKQDGMYAQGVYGFAPRWNAGLRLDAVGMTNQAFDGGDPDDASTSFRYTGQVTFAASEFSRLRAQLSKTDLHRPAGDHGHNNWAFFLQYNMSLGEHGAHAF